MDSCLYGYEFAQHRLTQILTEFNLLKIREIKFCGNLC